MSVCGGHIFPLDDGILPVRSSGGERNHTFYVRILDEIVPNIDEEVPLSRDELSVEELLVECEKNGDKKWRLTHR